jgi:DNA-binding MurR/RpiR family transcriptional regulator
VDTARRIEQIESTLTKSERRVAALVLRNPELVAFRTVAVVAEEAGVGAATVVRFAARLGMDGFGGLQAAVQTDLSRRLRPAAERIRRDSDPRLVQQHLALAVENVAVTLQRLDVAALEALVGRLSDPGSKVAVLTGDASSGVAHQLVGDLEALRDGVVLLHGPEVAVGRRLSAFTAADTVIAIDLRRYDRQVVRAVELAADNGAWVAAITDSPLSPLASRAAATFVVQADAVGPFDSHVGTLALADLLVAAVAERLREHASHRLDRAERTWRDHGMLVDE